MNVIVRSRRPTLEDLSVRFKVVDGLLGADFLRKVRMTVSLVGCRHLNSEVRAWIGPENLLFSGGLHRVLGGRACGNLIFGRADFGFLRNVAFVKAIYVPVQGQLNGAVGVDAFSLTRSDFVY